MRYEDRIKRYVDFDYFDDNNQKIGLIIQGNYIASNYIRILSPFSNISGEFVPYIIDSRDLEKFKRDLISDNFHFDIIIVQRDVLDWDFTTLLVDKCKLFGVKLIYETDDDIINIEESSPIYDKFVHKIEAMKYLARNSDCITVSTDILRDKMLAFNDNVFVIHNVLCDYWDLDYNLDDFIDNSNIIKIGYMGSRTHTKDLKIIEDAVFNVQKKCSDKDIIFEIVEGTTEDVEGIEIIRVPQNKEPYPNFAPWLQENIDWDIAIAPLVKEDNINLSKSELKYLEYTALKIPAIYSDVGPYSKAIVHEKNGMLVKDNTTVEWENNIFKLIDNFELRKSILINALNDIKNNYTMQNMLDDWLMVLNLNKRDKSSLLYSKVLDYYNNDYNCGFNKFLINKSKDILLESNLFDEEFYLNEYEDVLHGELSPVDHYLTFGCSEGCIPYEGFNKFNSIRHDYINMFGLNQFIFYLLYGNDSNYFKINVKFNNFEFNEKYMREYDLIDCKFYLEDNPDVKESNLSPFHHYSRYGYLDFNRNPSKYFSNKYYITKHLIDSQTWNPLIHYLFFGKEKGLKLNSWSFPNNYYLSSEVDLIVNNLNKKVFVLLPIYNYSSKIINCIESILFNTLNNYELVIFIDEELFKIDFNNFSDFEFENNIKFIFTSDKDMWTIIEDFSSSLSEDFVLLNSYSEVTYNWLNKLTVKAYSNKDIAFVSPCSNFIGGMSPFCENFEFNEYMLTANGIDTYLRKSSNKDLLYSQVADGFCIYVKSEFSNKFKLGNNLCFNYEDKICHMVVSDDVGHVIDDSTYIYHDVSFFDDNDSLFENYENDFSTELKVNKFLKSSFHSKFKVNLDLAIFDKTQKSLSNRLLYVMTQEEFESFKDFLGYYSILYYDCYFLTTTSNGFKLWDNFNLIKEWNLNLDFKNSEFRNVLFRDLYFNILYLLNINIIHIINFKYNSFDLYDIANLLNINIVLNCIDEYYLCPFKEDCNCSCDLSHCLNNAFKRILDIWTFNSKLLLNNSSIIVDEEVFNDYESIFNGSANIIKKVNYPKFNKNLINIFNPNKKSFTYLIVGVLSKDDIEFINTIEEMDVDNLLDLHFLVDNYDVSIDWGVYHGNFSMENFIKELKNINPNFIIIFNKFPEIYDVIYESGKHMCPVLLNPLMLESLSDKYYHCYDIPMDSYKDILDFSSQNKYYNMLKKMQYPDEDLNKDVVSITRCFSDVYATLGDTNSKEITFEKPLDNKGKKLVNYSNFDEFLINSYVSPLVYAPFNEKDEHCFRVMEGIANYLQYNSSNSSFNPLVSVIMPVYNREDIVLNAVETVLNQSYKNFELIIVDDGSTDDTRNVLKSISDDRVKLIFSKSNGGSSAARNLGLKSATGEYILYLDSDNEWEYNYIDVVLGAFLELPDADAIYSGQLLYRNIDEPPFAIRFGSLNKSLLLNGNYVDLNCFAHKKYVYDVVGGFDESLNRLVDWDIVLRVSNKFKMYSIPVLLSKYYFDVAKNRISDYSSKNHEKMMELFKNYARNIHNNNSIIQEPNYMLNKKVKIIIYNVKSLETIQNCINRIVSFDLNSMLDIIVCGGGFDKFISEYLSILEQRSIVNLLNFNGDSNEFECIIKSLDFGDVDSDLILLDVNAILGKNSIEFMQKYAYDIPDAGMIVPQQILPDGNRFIKIHVPYANPYFKCDINPSKYYKNIANVDTFHNGEVLELNWAPLFCVYLKNEVLNSFKNISHKSLDLDSFGGILADYIHNAMRLKIYHVSNAFVYNNSDKNIFDWGD